MDVVEFIREWWMVIASAVASLGILGHAVGFWNRRARRRELRDEVARHIRDGSYNTLKAMLVARRAEMPDDLRQDVEYYLFENEDSQHAKELKTLKEDHDRAVVGYTAEIRNLRKSSGEELSRLKVEHELEIAQLKEPVVWVTRTFSVKHPKFAEVSRTAAAAANIPPKDTFFRSEDSEYRYPSGHVTTAVTVRYVARSSAGAAFEAFLARSVPEEKLVELDLSEFETKDVS